MRGVKTAVSGLVKEVTMSRVDAQNKALLYCAALYRHQLDDVI